MSHFLNIEMMRISPDMSKTSARRGQSKVLYIIPGTEMEGEEIERRKRVLNSMASPNFSVDVSICKTGPPSIESYFDEYMSVPDTLRFAVRGEKEDYNALIIGCYGDPGLDAAREVVSIPVVGPGESSMLLACSLGDQFSILTVTDSVKKSMKKYAQRMGISERLASVRAIGIPVTEIGKRAKDAKHALAEEAKKAIREDGADVLILGCMSEGFLGVAEEMTREMKIPVLNPVSVSLKTAELLISCGLAHSRLAYLLPPKLQKVTSKSNFLSALESQKL